MNNTSTEISQDPYQLLISNWMTKYPIFSCVNTKVFPAWSSSLSIPIEAVVTKGIPKFDPPNNKMSVEMLVSIVQDRCYHPEHIEQLEPPHCAFHKYPVHQLLNHLDNNRFLLRIQKRFCLLIVFHFVQKRISRIV